MRPSTELALVSLCGVAFLAIPKPPAPIAPLAIFIVSCLLFWGAYLLGNLRSRRAEWGLVLGRGLWPTIRALALPAVALVSLGAVWAQAHDRPLVPRYLWLSMLLYPVWGLVQQWLVQALFVDNLRKIADLGTGWLVLIGAVAFGILHVEHPALWAATTAMGGVYVALFQRYRNLWPLGVLHGWLGSLFYPWVLNRNPMADLIDLLS